MDTDVSSHMTLDTCVKCIKPFIASHLNCSEHLALTQIVFKLPLRTVFEMH